MKSASIPVLVAFLITVFFACSRAVDPPLPPDNPASEKPVTSLALITFVSSAPSAYDSIIVKTDSVTKFFKYFQYYPQISYSYQGLQVARVYLVTGYGNYPGPAYYSQDYSIYYDANGRPVSGIRAFSTVNSDRFNFYTNTDSIRFTANNNNQVTEATFFSRKTVYNSLAPILRKDSMVNPAVIDVYTVQYDTAGSISKIHLDQGPQRKFDIEYTYGAAKAPMLIPINIYALDYINVSTYNNKLAMSILQARHELLKIKTTDLISGQVITQSFVYTYRKDGYPDTATVTETGVVSQNPNYTGNYKLAFSYNH